jgi:hypothetical protein
MGIILKKLDEFEEDYGFVIDFWNDNIMLVIEKMKKCGFKKYIKVVSKWKIKNKASSNEKLISEVHWKFPNIYFPNFLKF